MSVVNANQSTILNFPAVIFSKGEYYLSLSTNTEGNENERLWSPYIHILKVSQEGYVFIPIQKYGLEIHIML